MTTTRTIPGTIRVDGAQWDRPVKDRTEPVYWAGCYSDDGDRYITQANGAVLGAWGIK